MRPETSEHLEKAYLRLDTAAKNAAIEIWDIAGREAYLAAYHAAEALIFERTGNPAKTHRGVRSLFGRLTRHDPRIDRVLRSFLTEGYILKETADYETGPAAAVTEEKAKAAIETARRFVDCVAGLIDKQEA